MTFSKGLSIPIASWTIALLSLGTGLYTKEIILTLTGALSLSILFWYLLSLWLLSQIYSKEAKTLRCTISPQDAPAGTPIQFQLSPLGSSSVFRFSIPGIVSRYELKLRTADDKILSAAIPLSPARVKTSFPRLTIGTDPASRGVYFTEFSQVALYDVFGFYRFSIPLRHHRAEELILRPKPAQDGIPLTFHSGGSTRREEQTYQRTEELTEHRPYIPGDDPRRINWKLFGHSGDLFIRQGEQEPPPIAEYVLVLDTSVDYSLYSQEEGRLLVDRLCEEALAIALDLSRHHYAITLCFPGSNLHETDEATVSRILAYPSAIDLHANKAFPDLPASSSLLIVAIPRTLPASSSALSMLLAGHFAHKKLHSINPSTVLKTSKYQNYYEAFTRYYGQVHGI